ncbi:MAG: extracellular solute-binding protein [bacterium]
MLKKFSKKLILMTTLMIGCAFSLNGCNTETSQGLSTNSNVNANENSEKVVLTMWHYYNGNTKDMLDNMIKEFNETVGAEKNIQVDAYSFSRVSDLASALISSANKEVGVDDMPDIFSAYSDTALVLNDMGILANIDDYLTNDEMELFRQDFLEEGRFGNEGNLKILPVAKSTEILFINETDFKIFAEETSIDINLLETWEGLAEAGEIYYNWTDDKTPDIPNDGQALFGIDSEANFMLVLAKQLGEEMYDYSDYDNITFGLSEESAKKIWDYYITPYIKGYYVSYGNFRSDDVKSGDLLMYAGSTSSVYYFPEQVELGRIDAYNIEGIALPYPYFEDGKKVGVQQGAGMLVTKSEEIREAGAVEFLKWFTSPEYNIEFAVSTGYMPVQNNALSYNSVLEVMPKYSIYDTSNIVQESIRITYNDMLPEYEFYANKPFNGSYDTRNVIADSILDILEYSMKELKEQLDLGVNKEEVIEQLISEESFKSWYNGFEISINKILEENK